LNTEDSTCSIFVKATGGMSLAVGIRCPLDAGANVCERPPVRTIGGCNKVEIAVAIINQHDGFSNRADILTILTRLPQCF
jgi:hypothetical protein